MIIENVPTLKIHKLTQAQYNRLLEAGAIDTSALYLTPDDQSDIESIVSQKVAEAVADRTQLTPEYADSIEECTDTSKLYVLPDGYLYAYALSAEAAYNNIVSTLLDVDLDGVFNGVGYMNDYYVSTSAPYYGSDAETVMTGLIPFDSKPVIYIKGLTFDTAKSHTRVGLFSSEGVCFQTINFSLLGEYFSAEKLSEEYYKFTPLKEFESTAYVAFSGLADTGATLIVTLNEKIVEGASYAWRNTGHAFVPADYEDRIINLENETTNIAERVNTLESITQNINDTPSYVQEEAERVIQTFLPNVSKKSLNFVALSDFHETGDGEVSSLSSQIMESSLHACQGAKHIAQCLNLDFVAVLGDKIWGDNTTTMEQGRQATTRINRYISSVAGNTPVIDTSGNHDLMTYSYAQNMTYFMSGEMSLLYDGYRYKDFEDKKCRIIVLNTMDYDGAEVNANTGVERVSGEQLQWFAESLDLSTKSDSANWKIILFAHHPIDNMTGMPLANCLQAYLTGSAYSVTHNGVDVYYDFSGKNAAQVLYQFHGHLHNFKVDYIRYLKDGVATTTTVKRICIPNVCFYRSNEYGENGVTENYGIEFGEDITYEKTANCAEDTAFCAVSVNLDTGDAFAAHYGAGYDREINY